MRNFIAFIFSDYLAAFFSAITIGPLLGWLLAAWF